MAISFDLKDIKPLLSAVGLGDAPDTTSPKVDALPPPPMAPPGLPPPTPAAAGFQGWYADPRTKQKLADGMVAPGTPINPPPPSPPPFLPAGSGYENAGQMASVNPPQKNYAFLNPPSPAAATAPQADAAPPSLYGGLPTSAPTPQQAMQTNMNLDQAANPQLYQKPMLTGRDKIGNILNFATAGLLGAAGGLHGDPAAGVRWVGEQRANDLAIPQNNAAIYRARNIQPLQDAAALADTQSQTAERSAKAQKDSTQADDMAPFVMSKDQAAAINRPELAGMQTTGRYYSQMLTGAGHDTARTDAATTRATTAKELASMKPQQRDDHYIQVMSKPAAQRTPEDLAFKNGYEQMVNTKTTQPGVARAAAFASMRPVQVIDPDTNNVVYQTAGSAMRSGAATPMSADYAAGKSLEKSFTSGDGAKNLNAFNTATAHLETLGKAAEALHNGDIQAVNNFGNQFNKQTGNPAPTNFQAVKNAVAGEVSKTFKGGGATDAEIKEANDTISASSSPAQLRGVIETYKDLMASKRQALEDQYTMGKQGKPNFGKGITAPPAGGSSIPPEAAAQLQEGVVHTFGNGQQWTKTNGTPVRVK